MGISMTLDRNHCASSRELAIRIALWAHQLGRVPFPEEISERFQLPRASGYRWRNAWCDANGIPIPPRRHTLSMHHREITKPGGNRHPQTTVQGP